jgi:hypothetical protein
MNIKLLFIAALLSMIFSGMIAQNKIPLNHSVYDDWKKDKLPKDSLGIWLTSTGEILKFANLKSINIPKYETNWLAFLMEETIIKKDKGDILIIMNPITGDSVSYKNVTKDAKEPIWMKYGIPAIEKGSTFGFELE